MIDDFDMQAAQATCDELKRCFQLGEVILVQACISKLVSYFEESVIDQFVADIRVQASAFDEFISLLPSFEKATHRQRLDAEMKFYAILSPVQSLNKRDITRAGAMFALIYTKHSADEAATTSLELLSAISMMRLQNDGDTVFSIKSREPYTKHPTVCGANILGALSPISEQSGIQYEPIQNLNPSPEVQKVTTQLQNTTIPPSTTTQPVRILTRQPESTQVPNQPMPQQPSQVPMLSYQNISPTWQSSIPQAPLAIPPGMHNPWQALAQQPYHQHTTQSNTLAIDEADHQSKLSQLEQYTKLKANLIRGAPQFDGKSDFDMFITNLHEYLADLPYITEPLKKAVLKSTCKGVAQEYLGTIPALASQSFENIIVYLYQRFGRDILSKKLYFDSITQKPTESLQEYADRIQRAAIGTQRTNEEVINRFICGLKDKNLAEKLSILDFQNIPQVLAKAQKHSHVKGYSDSTQRTQKTFDKRPDKTHNNSSSSQTKGNTAVQSKGKPKPYDKKKPFSKDKSTKKANQIEQDSESEPESDSETESDTEIAMNNLVEIFSLSNDEFSDSLDEVLSAKTEKTQHKYNLRSTGGISKPSTTSSEQQQHIKQVLFPSKPESQPPKVQPQPDAEMKDVPTPTENPPPQPKQPTRTYRTRTGTREVPAPAFQPLYGEKPAIGDYLALLCGNNDFLQKVLLQELKNRYFELTTVPKTKSATAQAVISNPPRRSPLQYNLVKLNHGEPVCACADTGAEISLISTSALEKAQVKFSWNELSDGHPVKGISSVPQKSKTIVVKMQFVHEEQPLNITVALSVIDSKDYRFLIGRDILKPLKFNISADGLTLTSPKSGETALYKFHTASALTVTSDMPSINTTELYSPIVLKGEQNCEQQQQTPSTSDISPQLNDVLASQNLQIRSQATKGDLSLHSHIINLSPSPPPSDLDTKGDWGSSSPVAIYASHDQYGNPYPSVLRQIVSHEQGGSDLCDDHPIQFIHLSRPPASFYTKGDDLPQVNVTEVSYEPDVHEIKSYQSPLTLTTQGYVGKQLIDILQIEQLLVNVNQLTPFSDWGLSDDCPDTDSVISKDEVVNGIDIQTLRTFDFQSLPINLPNTFFLELDARDVPEMEAQFTKYLVKIVYQVKIVNNQSSIIILLSDTNVTLKQTIVPKVIINDQSFPLIISESSNINDSLQEAQIRYHKLCSNTCFSVIANQPYELSNERFHTFNNESYEVPSQEEAEKFLISQQIRLSESTSHNQRGALVLYKTQELNPKSINPELPEEYKRELWQVLFDFQDVCAFGFPDMPQPALVEPFVINTGDSNPIACRYYRLPPKIEAHLRAELDTNTALGLQQNSSSPWASPLFAVPKPGKPGVYRTVADFRPLNNVTVPDRYPLPLISQIFQEIGSSSYYHANDLLSGFWQIPCHENSIAKTAVTTRWGLYEYTRTPQGVRNAPAHFMRTINGILTKKQLHHNNRAFVDDLTSHGAQFQESLIALRQVLEALREKRMFISPTKMRWGYRELQLLGHTISQGILKCQENKLAAIQNLIPPADVSLLRSFLGIVGYYRQFISNFAAKAAPLFQLLKKDVEYVWSPQCQLAFQNLKQDLQSDPVLSFPTNEPSAQFIVYTDWSIDGISAILHQSCEGVEKVVEYASKSCNKHEQKYCPTEGELLAIIFGLAKFRSYLLGQEFVIVTDHSALQYLNTPRASPKLARWGLFLSEFTFTVRHRKGTQHVNADALSRMPASADDKFQLSALMCEQGQDLLLSEPLPDITSQSALSVNDVTPLHCPKVSTMQQELLESSPCNICGEDEQGDRPQLICDGCNELYHLSCLHLAKIPSTYWYCTSCSQRYHQAHQYNVLFDVEFQQYCLGSRKPSILSREVHFKALHDQGYDFQSHTLIRVMNGQPMQIPSPGRQILLIEETHVRNGHVGAGRLFDLLSLEYWWPGMRSMIQMYVAQCLNCQLEKATYNREDELIHLPQPSAARQHWHIDLAPDLPVEKGTNQLVVCQDQYTKYIVLGCLKTRTSQDVASWFLEHIIAVFGVPTLIRSDQGVEFKGAFDSLCNDSRITHYAIAPHSPWSNGMAERLVRTVKSYLKRMAITEGELGWPKWLPHLQLGYNLAKHPITKYAPFELMFGSKGRFIIEEPSVHVPFKTSTTDHF